MNSSSIADASDLGNAHVNVSILGSFKPQGCFGDVDFYVLYEISSVESSEGSDC
jgi:hypothetical protein